jgi:hypothetical protein
MTGGDVLRSYSLEDLCSRCREQTRLFRRGESFDDGYCFEVFRRAIAENDQECWRELHEIYHDQVLAWCRRAHTSSLSTPEELMALAWEKFWQSFRPGKLALAESTAAIQRYLKACTHSAAIDIARDHQASVSIDRPVTEGGDGPSLRDLLVDASPTPDQSLAVETSRASFWDVVSKHLTNEQEKVLIYLKFEMGLKSSEVQSRRPDLFAETGEVYRVTRNLLDRLKRSPELRSWIGEESS